MKLWVKIPLLVLGIPVGLLFLIAIISQIVPSKPPKDFVVTHNLVNLSQIDNFSRFRSCDGHKSMSQFVNEPPSSMAHYVYSKVRGEGGSDTVKIFAPFDGYVTHNLIESIVDKHAFAFVPKSSKFPWWPFNQYRIHISHAHTLPQFGNTSPVKAGELVGYADIPESFNGQKPYEFVVFDIRMGIMAIPPQIKDGNGEPYKNMDSVFRYMTDGVMAEYQAAIPGVKGADDFIIPVSWRQLHPCRYRDGTGPYFDHSPEDYLDEKYGDRIFVGEVNSLENIQKKLDCWWEKRESAGCSK